MIATTLPEQDHGHSGDPRREYVHGAAVHRRLIGSDPVTRAQRASTPAFKQPRRRGNNASAVVASVSGTGAGYFAWRFNRGAAANSEDRKSSSTAARASTGRFRLSPRRLGRRPHRNRLLGQRRHLGDCDPGTTTGVTQQIGSTTWLAFATTGNNDTPFDANARAAIFKGLSTARAVNITRGAKLVQRPVASVSAAGLAAHSQASPQHHDEPEPRHPITWRRRGRHLHRQRDHGTDHRPIRRRHPLLSGGAGLPWIIRHHHYDCGGINGY